MSTLRVSVAAGEAGPIIALAGEADVSNADQLRDVVTAQLATGTVYLTIEASELTFADSRSIGILTGAAKTLKELGGDLVLLRPRRALVRTLTLLGVDQVLTIHAATTGVPAACQNGPESADIERHQDDEQIRPDQHRTS